MLPAWFVIIAVATRLLGGSIYANAVIKRRAHPNPITWFFWALTPIIVITAQIFEHVSLGAMAITFALGLSPFVVFLLSLKYSFSKSHFTIANSMCAIFAVAGIILWLTTNDPVLAIIFSILADAWASLPTVIKAFRDPKSEVPFPYFLSLLSMVVALLTVTHWTLANFAYPAYIFFINLIIFSLVYFRLGRPKKLTD